MMEDSKPYIAIPLYCLRGIISDRQRSINNAIDAGIVNYARRKELNEYDALKSCIIEYVNEETLFDEVKEYLDRMNIQREYLFDNGVFDMDYFFSNGDYDSEISEELKDQFFANARLITALRSLGITCNNPERLWYTGLDNIKGNIYVMLNKDLLFDFRDNDKTDYELVQFMIYCALQSIIGQKEAIKTNMAFVFNRVFPRPNKAEKLLIGRYSKPYHWQKLINSLELNWGLKYYSYYTRGFYFSFRLNMERLAIFSEKNKLGPKIKALEGLKKEAKKAAIEKAIEELREKMIM